jgi:predicted AAA+ superfamily ATPase
MNILMFLIKLFVVFIVIYKIYDKLTCKYLNPYKLYLLFGKKGSGKSTYLCKLATKYLRKNWLVYTNMHDMMIDGVRWFEIEHLGDYVPEKNSLLLLDEVGMIWDSRDFKKFRPEVRDFFKLQRHYNVIVYMASQTFDVDKKIRDLTDGMYLHINKFRVFSVGKRITRRVTLTESTSEAESRISENLSFTSFLNWTYTYIPKWVKYFDSYVTPDLPKLPYVKRTVPEHHINSSKQRKAKNLINPYQLVKNKLSKPRRGL